MFAPTQHPVKERIKRLIRLLVLLLYGIGVKPAFAGNHRVVTKRAHYLTSLSDATSVAISIADMPAS